MSKYSGGISFTKPASSNESSNEEKPQSGSMAPKSMSMMSSVHDEYSDLESEDDAPNSASFGHNPMHNVQDTVNHYEGADTNIQRYGLGAKLMMQMGYQLGKGLGANQEGIVNPIQTKLRPQGAGVGAIHEKVGESRSAGTGTKTPGESSVLPKLKGELFDVIEALEHIKVEVPLRYKELADRPDSTAEELESARAKLSDVRVKVEKLDSSIRVTQSGVDIVARRQAQEAEDLEISQQLLEKLESISGGESLTDTTAMLKDLSEQFSHYRGIQDIFVALASVHLRELFLRAEGSDGDFLILAGWALYFRAVTNYQEDTLNAWDMAILNLLKEHIASSNESLRKQRDTLAFWLDSSVIINTPLATEACQESILAPLLNEMVQQHELAKGLDSEVFDYLDLFPNDRYVRDLCSRFRAYFADSWEAFLVLLDRWKYYTSRIQPVLSLFLRTEELLALHSVDVGFEVVSNAEICRALIKALSGCTKDHIVRSTKDSVDVVLDLAFQLSVFSAHQAEVILQFLVLNPWILSISKSAKFPDDTRNDRAGLSDSIREWSTYLRHALDRFPGLEPLFVWYINAALQALEISTQHTNARVPLPLFRGKTTLTDDETLLLLSPDNRLQNGNEAGTPMHELVATFKNVVEHYCLEHDLLFLPDKDAAAARSYVIRNLETGKEVKGEIRSNVLWVGTSSLRPISLGALREYLE